MIGDFLKKHIYDPGDGQPKAGISPAQAAPPQQMGSPVRASPGGAAPYAQPSIDADMLADIQKVVARRANSAFAFLEEKANTLRGAGLDDMTATKAAFQLLKADGKTADSVISSIDLHVRDIETEKTTFASGAQSVSNKKVAALRTEALQLIQQNQNDDASITQLDAQIQQLRARMAERVTIATQKQMDADAAEADIQLKVNQFNTAADSVIVTLNNKKMTLSSMLS